MKLKLSKDKIEIVKNVKADIENKDTESISKLLQFYFKIIVEPNITTKSFRYIHAYTAFVTICEETNDIESLRNLEAYHANKLKFDRSNPVKKKATSKSNNSSTKRTTKTNKEVNVNIGLGL